MFFNFIIGVYDRSLSSRQESTCYLVNTGYEQQGGGVTGVLETSPDFLADFDHDKLHTDQLINLLEDGGAWHPSVAAVNELWKSTGKGFSWILAWWFSEHAQLGVAPASLVSTWSHNDLLEFVRRIIATG